MKVMSICLLLITTAIVVNADGEDMLTLGECVFEKHQEPHDAMKKLEDLNGKRFSVKDDQYGYVYDIGICTTGISPESLPVDPEVEWSKAGAIQTSTKDQKRKMLGDLRKTEVMSGKNWLQLEYQGGQNYGTHCGSTARRAIVMVVCDPTSQGVLELVEENTNKSADCYYLFELSHSSVCDMSSSSGLSAGSIVLIVLASLVGGYLLLGFLYQRFAAGAQGKEQIPNYAFWQDVGNMAADGCDFVCRSNARGSGSRQYRGIGDEQITQQTPEDPPSDTDDHLLSM